MTTAWIMLFIAGLFETAWVLTLRLSDGWSRISWTLATIALMIASFLLLGRASRSLPAATAYAVWVGIGVTGAALLSPLLFKETLSLKQLAFLAMILVGIIGLKLSTPDSPASPSPSPTNTP